MAQLQSSLDADEVSCRARTERCPSSENCTEDTPLCSKRAWFPRFLPHFYGHYGPKVAKIKLTYSVATKLTQLI